MRPWYLLLGIALAAGACSASGYVLDQPEVVSTPPSDLALVGENIAAPVPTPTRAPIAEPDGEVAGGLLRLAIVGGPVLDPVQASAVAPTDMVVLDLLYDSLTAWDARAVTWVPSIGTGFVVSDDGLSWTVSLSGATFSDGIPITAGDVKRSLERIRDGDLSLAGTRLEILDDIVAVDFATVRFELSRPFALLPHLLSSPLFGIVPSGELDGTVGSGGFVLAAPGQLRPRDGLDLSFGGVNMVTVETDAEAAGLRDSGGVDMAFVSSAYDGPTDVSTAAAIEAHFALNVASENLSDPSFRRSVVEAVATGPVVTQVFGAGATPIDQLTPGEIACGERCEHAEAYESATVELSIAYVADTHGVERALAEAAAAQLTQSGIAATASEYDLAGFVDLVGGGGHDLVRTGWIGLFPSADSQLSPYRSDSPDNVSGYASQAFDALLDEARASVDATIYDKARAVVQNDAPVLPVARLRVRVLLSGAVERLQLRHDGTFDVDELIVFS